jgi:adenylate cyclase
LTTAEQSGDDFALDLARTARGITLVHQGGPQREAGFELLAKIRERALDEGFSLIALPVVDIHFAREKARLGDLDGAIALARTVVDDLFDSGGCIWSALATTVLVEALVQRGGEADPADAQAAIDRLAAIPTDPGFVLTKSHCSGCGRCWPEPTATRPAIGSFGIVTAPRRHRWALKGLWPWRRP